MVARFVRLVAVALGAVLLATPESRLAAKQAATAPAIGLFLDLGSSDAKAAAAAAPAIASDWRDGYAAMLIDMARLLPGIRRADDLRTISIDEGPERASSDLQISQPGSPVRARLIRFLEQRTNQRFGDDLARWRQWMWKLPYQPHPDYAQFKAAVYARIDPAMRQFFADGKSSIRLDEIDWGGVKVNGIPPLIQPRVVGAAEAAWLRDDHQVFGVVVNGQARAYPKRILAWHEMALDRVGGVDLTLVYCTLCGTAIPYESRVGGVLRTFGTSGLLYRSNKLMFDAETRSLWSTLEGRPVLGPLVGSGLTLVARPIVTTSWGEWRRQHPDTSVLSLETGMSRNYAEGEAYREYFSTDRLMFRTPFEDRRLANKDEILGVLVPVEGGGRLPVAFATATLAKRRVLTTTVGGRALVVLTTAHGANRVYDAGPHAFVAFGANAMVTDATGRRWKVEEESLVSDATPAMPPRPRISAFRAFWFGWHAQFPDTQLIK